MRCLPILLLAITLTGCCRYKPFWHRQYVTYGSPDELVVLEEELITPDGVTLARVNGPLRGARIALLPYDQRMWHADCWRGELITNSQETAEQFAEESK